MSGDEKVCLLEFQFFKHTWTDAMWSRGYICIQQAKLAVNSFFTNETIDRFKIRFDVDRQNKIQVQVRLTYLLLVQSATP